MQDWVVNVVRDLGVVGIALLMLAENVFPPLPSEVIMPLAGYLSTRQQVSFWGAVLAGSAGSPGRVDDVVLDGTSPHARPALRHRGATRRRARADPRDIDNSMAWFQARGRYSVCSVA